MDESYNHCFMWDIIYKYSSLSELQAAWMTYGSIIYKNLIIYPWTNPDALFVFVEGPQGPLLATWITFNPRMDK